MIKNLKKKKGFTLIELIVVIAILGILAAVAVPRLTGFQDSARKKTDINNARLIGNNIEIAIAEGRISLVGGAFTKSASEAWTVADEGVVVAAGSNPSTANVLTMIETRYFGGADLPTPQYEGTAFVVTPAGTSFTITNGTHQCYPTPGGDYAEN